MLLTLTDILTADELAQMHELLGRSAWQDGHHTAGNQAIAVKNNTQLGERSPALPELRRIVLGALQRSPTFFSAALPRRVLPPFFNRYTGAANHYGFHTDNAIRGMPDGESYLRTDVSATLFLSRPEDYDGGELVIDDTFGRHGVKLAAGSLVLYPSSSIHEVRPVTRGERLASFMFIQSFVRDAEQRRLLHELDNQLITLRSELGETPPLVRLTGIYHNLLRRWSET